MPAPFTGGCRCGAVRYECTAEPIATIHCHCRDCHWLKPGLEIWTESAQPWAPRSAGIAQMPRNPG